MIGNDVVDLRLAKLQSNWQRPRYLSKIFTPKEQLLIATAENKTIMVWRLWTMKEAGYKAHQRRFNLHPKLNPTAFECSLNSEEKGKVVIGLSEYETRTKTEKEYLYSEAFVTNSLKWLSSKLEKNRTSHSLKKELIKQLSIRIKMSSSQFEIEKCKHHIPRLYCNKKEIKISFSLTSHGKFSAFAIEIPD